MIEVWRPGRPQRTPPASAHRRPRRANRRLQAAPAADAAARGAAPQTAARRRGGSRGAVAAARARRTVRTASNAANATRAASGKSGKSATNASAAMPPTRRAGGRAARAASAASQVERAEREQYYAKPFGGGGRQQQGTGSQFALRQARGAEGAARAEGRALAPRLRLGSPAHRQMAVARARGAHAQRRRRAWSKPATSASTAQRVAEPSQPVRAGDVVTLALDRTVRVLEVQGFSERRGGPAAGRALYRDLTTQFRQQGLRLCRRLAYGFALKRRGGREFRPLAAYLCMR